MEKSRLLIFLITCTAASVHLGAIIPLFSFISYDLQLSAAVSGFVAAMTPLGGLIVTFFSERVVRRFGFQRTMMIGLSAQLALLALLIAAPYSLMLWIVARFLLGVTFSFVFMPPQTSIAVEVQNNKAFYVNLLGVVFGIGLTIGPILTNLKVFGARIPLLAIFLLYIFVFTAVPFVKNSYPPAPEQGRKPMPRLRVLKLIWVAILPAVLFGFCELSLMAIFPMEALQRNLTEAQTSIIVALFPLCALLGQIPVSLLSDRFGPKNVAPFLYGGSMLVFALPLIHYSLGSLLLMSICIGMLIGHGYYFSVSYVNSIIDRDNVIRANILIETIYNIFTIIVPLLVGYYLQSMKTTVFIPMLLMSFIVLLTHIIRSSLQRRNKSYANTVPQ